PFVQAGAEAGRQQRGEALAGHLPAGEEAAPVGRVFGQEGGGAAELAAGREALDHARGHDADGRPDADGGVGRHQRDQQGAEHHQHDGQRQRGAPADAVGIDPQHQRAERTHEEGHAERAQRQQQRDAVVVAGKEQPRNGHGEEAVDDQVEPFQRIADRGGGDDAPGGRRRPAGGWGERRGGFHGRYSEGGCEAGMWVLPAARAMASISTSAPGTIKSARTVERAGRTISPKKAPYAASKAAKSSMRASQTVVLTMSRGARPASARWRAMCSRQVRVCAVTSSPTMRKPSPKAIWPDTNTRSPARRCMEKLGWRRGWVSCCIDAPSWFGPATSLVAKAHMRLCADARFICQKGKIV